MHNIDSYIFIKYISPFFIWILTSCVSLLRFHTFTSELVLMKLSTMGMKYGKHEQFI